MKVASSSNTLGTQKTFLASLSSDQYTQLVNMLQPHLQNSVVVANEGMSGITHVAGTCSLSPRNNNCTWVIDFDATSHICFDRNLFTNIRPVDNMSVILPTLEKFVVELIGDISLTPDIVLLDVLCVPSFVYNLISVSALLHNSEFAINFYGTTCLIQDKLSMKTIGKVESHGGLYLLRIPQVASVQQVAITCKISLEHGTNVWAILLLLD